MCAWYPVGWRYKHSKIFDGNRQDIVPPLGIILLLPFSVLWMTTTLFISLFGDRDFKLAMAFAAFGAIIPIAIGYGVLTNRLWTRLATVVTFAAFVLLVEFEHGIANTWQLRDAPILIAGGALWIVTTAYLYGARTARAYYLIIAGRELPASLQGVSLEPPNWIVVASRVCGSIAEWALVLLALAIFFGIFIPR